MIIKVTTKGGFKLKQTTFDHINNQFKKIGRFLPHLKPDLPLLTLLIKKSNNKYYPQKEYDRPGLAHYEGLVNLRLPKKSLYAHFKGQTIEECTRIGFKYLIKEIKKYKDLHFKAQSEYPSHSTVRRW